MHMLVLCFQHGILSTQQQQKRKLIKPEETLVCLANIDYKLQHAYTLY